MGPHADEVPYNGVDDDCDPKTSDTDVDGDGHEAEEVGGDDCDDTDPDSLPGGTEVADDGVDQDCSGSDLESTTLAGADEASGTSRTMAGDRLLAQALELDDGAMLTGIGLFASDPGVDVVVGVYEDDAGVPGDLLFQTSADVTVEGFQVLEAPSPTAAGVGTWWVAVHLGGSAELGSLAETDAAEHGQDAAWTGALPPTWGSSEGGTSATLELSLRGYDPS